MSSNGRFCISRFSKMDFTENQSDRKILKFLHCTYCTYLIDRKNAIGQIVHFSNDSESMYKALLPNLINAMPVAVTFDVFGTKRLFPRRNFTSDLFGTCLVEHSFAVLLVPGLLGHHGIKVAILDEVTNPVVRN